MPTTPPAPEGPRGRPPLDCRRVLIDPGGPMVVEGPVEVVLPDGTSAVSERFMVAVCACRRSRSYPWCDTSHRRRGPGPRSGSGAERGTEAFGAPDAPVPGPDRTHGRRETGTD